MAALDDNDPILTLSDQILRLFHGHQYRTIIAALAGTLGFVLDRGAAACDEPLAVAALRDELKQVVAEILHHRRVEGQTRSSARES